MSIAPKPTFDCDRTELVRVTAPPWRRSWRTLRTGALRLARRALPQSCALCAGHAGESLICRGCANALPRSPAACPVCAEPNLEGATCGRCLAHPPPFAATTAAFAYAFPVDRLLQQLKYGGRLAYADWAAGELASAAGPVIASRNALERPDCVAALPLAKPRQHERGFNQAREIAVRVAHSLDLPLVDALERVNHGAPQATLPWAQRRANVRGAFAATPDAVIEGRSIALVDDVMTTGATLIEAAAALRRAGAARVECWVVARTPPPERAWR